MAFHVAVRLLEGLLQSIIPAPVLPGFLIILTVMSAIFILLNLGSCLPSRIASAILDELVSPTLLRRRYLNNVINLVRVAVGIRLWRPRGSETPRFQNRNVLLPRVNDKHYVGKVLHSLMPGVSTLEFGLVFREKGCFLLGEPLQVAGGSHSSASMSR